MNLTCPSCGANVLIPAGFTGIQKQCRSCRNFVQVPRGSAPVASEALGAEEATAPPPRAAGPVRRRVVYRKPIDRDDGPFEFESKGTNAGLLGGIAMMAVAAIWFFVGLAGGIIFFYPPILFIVGLIASINGLASGNLTGSQHRTPRPRRRR